ncbi:amino acid ABC transporter permease [Ruminococcaceae bacterium OttesenSCG-928-O06]|nr:amino acid ABC transporter permease [Ruminococcaceae bacterium OttesenSCG-928-O06]
MAGIWDTLVEQFTKTFITQDRYLLFLEGLRNTLYISLMAIAIGTVLGVCIALVKVSPSKNIFMRVLSKVLGAYVAVVRGTPLATQLLIMTYIVIRSGNYVFTAGITFGLNSGAYVSEVIRAGIAAVDIGQMEAGRSLGLRRRQVMQKIILPQAVKNILPALVNEFIAIIKETSIVGLISVTDLTRASDLVRSRTLEPYFPLLSIALVYFLIVMGLTQVASLLEKRLAKSDRS